MIAPSFYADLLSRGVRLSIAATPKAEASPELPALKLRVQAAEGALILSLREAIQRHREELLAYVFDLEERAAVLEYDGGHAREEAERLALGGANPDGRLYLRDLAENHPAVRHMLTVFNAEVVEVGREAAA
jgi:hypothetical protein